MTYKAIVHEAKEFAGVFYDQDRSALFRTMWPNQDEYVRTKWPHFVAAVRQVWSGMLGQPEVPDNFKEYIFKALISDANADSSMSALDVVQLAPGTQQFHGDPYENRQTASNIGNGGSTHRHLMMSGAKYKFK